MPLRRLVIVPSRKNRHIFHWIITGAFIALFITGLIIFTPPLGVLAAGGWTRIIHRVAAIILVITPGIYGLTNWQAALNWLRGTYFWRDKTTHKPAILGTWRKLHRTITVVGYFLFAITGMVMWFLKGAAPGYLMQWVSVFHGMFFILSGIVLLYHIFFEIDWWRWKRKNCRSCNHYSCIAICHTGAMIRKSPRASVIEFHRDKCDGCGLCMQLCRLMSW